ncbi:glycosyltransferase family 2 protein [Paraburkholderia bannensis]|uniref:glycosyltransferase family 2 protein n=2 Tax=Paraburkholderia bannensis TaxID=765414 RepID=UPI00048084CD|nr:glycosyltransferase family 2 protein [Paraburkholderia bannensis]
MKVAQLGVAIITMNAAQHLAECLQSVRFAGEIVVLDSGSTDNTVEIARQHGARVIETADWPGFGVQKNRAIAELSTPWILSLDADEIVSPELAQSIRVAIAQPELSAYAVDRLSSFCGEWIYHSGWYPDWIPRLFPRELARFSNDLVHERLVYDVPCKRLEGKLLHYSYDSYEAVLRKMDAYSTLGAEQRRAVGKKSSVRKALGRGAWAFIRTYVLRRGFLDGRAGLIIAVYNAETVYYRFLKLTRFERVKPQ